MFVVCKSQLSVFLLILGFAYNQNNALLYIFLINHPSLALKSPGPLAIAPAPTWRPGFSCGHV